MKTVIGSGLLGGAAGSIITMGENNVIPMYIAIVLVGCIIGIAPFVYNSLKDKE